MKILVATIAATITIATLLLPSILVHAYSDTGSVERSVMLKVTNTKTGLVKTSVWNLKGYTFQHTPIKVSDSAVKKIKQIFGSDSFSFTLHNKAFQGKWLHFNVELVGNNILPGKRLTIKFV